jgi:hypothetical protein
MPTKVNHSDEFIKFKNTFLNAMDTYQARKFVSAQNFDSFDKAAGFSDVSISRIKGDEVFLNSLRRFDANESAFFARQLEFIKAQTYDVKYPETWAQTVIPVSSEAGPGAQSITYRQFDIIGKPAPVAQRGDDLPRVDTFAKEFTYPVVPFGLSYGYTLDEIRSAMFGNVPLEQRKANAARDAYERDINRYGWFANGTTTWCKLVGLIYDSDVQHNAAATGAWLDANGALQKTVDQVIADINTAITQVMTNTLGIERANTVLLPIAEMAMISRTPRSTISDTTILQFVKDNNPGVEFMAIPELSKTYITTNPRTSAGPAVNLLIAFDSNAQKLEYAIPQPFEQLPIQERNLEFVIPCHYRLSSVMKYYPKSINVYDGI